MTKPPDTVFVQGSSGSIIKMDVPTNPHARGNYEAAIASGELRVVDPKSVTEETTRFGGVIYVVKDQPAPRKRAATEPSE